MKFTAFSDNFGFYGSRTPKQVAVSSKLYNI